MLFNLLNLTTSYFLKNRLKHIESFIKYPEIKQQAVLKQLLSVASQTEIGKKFDFQSIKSYENFRNRLPIVSYEDIEPMITRSRKGERNIFWNTPIQWFAKSSGTTNAKSKFIPVSKEALYDCHYKAGKDMLCLYLNNNENSELFKGKSLRLGGSKEIYQENGTFFGDLSAILIENLPFWADFASCPSKKTSLMGEWETKMKAIVEQTSQKDIRSLVGVPSWLLVLLNQILEQNKKENLLELWKNLEVYFHGGVSFLPYKEQYQKIIPSEKFQYYETYNASEGFFAIQDRNRADDMLLMLDYGIFYEFIPMSEFGSENCQAIPIWEVKENVNYAMVITTNSGLWRYLIGDTIRFTSTNPHRIKITGRTKHFINAFGEELIIENTDEAIKKACDELNCSVLEYSVAPIFMVGKEKGGHQWLIEFGTQPTDLKHFTEVIDNELKKLNSDYEAKRYNDMTLQMPKIEVAKQGLFHHWLKTKNKLGGQHKIPRLANHREFMEEFLNLNNS